jgi:pyruvate dehydrogenase E2 component (dihydrolipoamide acetyltransferase)
MSSVAKKDAALARRRDRVLASPRARRAMRRHGTDPAAIRGSGPGGRIVEADVLRGVAARPAAAADSPGEPGRFPPAIFGPDAIFRAEADVTALVSLVQQMRAHAPQGTAGDFTLAQAIRRAIDLALGEGTETSRALGEGSIAIVDLGGEGVDEAAIMPRGPEAGVLAIGRVVPGPEPPAGQPVRSTLRLTLTADLRSIDAQTAAGLLRRIVELVQRPLVLFLERLRS